VGFAAEPCASTAEPLLSAETGAAAEATADSSAAAELRTHLRERKPLDLARKLVRPQPAAAWHHTRLAAARRSGAQYGCNIHRANPNRHARASSLTAVAPQRKLYFMLIASPVFAE
jgi:hypothetical protein